MRVLALGAALWQLPGGCAGREDAGKTEADTTRAELAPAPAALAGIAETDGVKIHVQTGLIAAPGYELVVATCTACHSARLITQSRQTRKGWAELLRWMQQNHNLWALPPERRDAILDYLAANYGVPDAHGGRRAPLPSYLMPPTRAELAGMDRGGHTPAGDAAQE